MKKSLIKGIMCVTGGFLLHFTLGTVYTFGNMSPYIASYLRSYSNSKWVQNSQMLWIYAFSIGCQGMSMTLGGILEKRIGGRYTCLIGCLTMSIAVMLTYFTIQQNLYLVILTYGAFTGLGTGLTYTVAIAEAIKWFPYNRGLIIGIVVAGFGLGSLVFNQVQTAFINPLNLFPNVTSGDDKYFNNEAMLLRVPQCFLLIGGIYACLQLIGAFLMSAPTTWEEEEEIIHIEGLSREIIVNESEIVGDSQDFVIPLENTNIMDLTPRQAIKKRDFWILWLQFIFNGTMNIFITSLYKTYGQTYIKDDFYLALVGSIASIFNSTGRILWGQVMDRNSYKTAMRIITIIVLVFSATLPASQYISSPGGAKTMHMIWCCVIMGTICGTFAILPSATAKVFGTANVAIIYGMLFSANGIAGIVGALSTTFLQSTIDYLGIFELGAGLCLLSFFLTFFHKNEAL